MMRFLRGLAGVLTFATAATLLSSAWEFSTEHHGAWWSLGFWICAVAAFAAISMWSFALATGDRR